jgi:hypothetical protein
MLYHVKLLTGTGATLVVELEEWLEKENLKGYRLLLIETPKEKETIIITFINAH